MISNARFSTIETKRIQVNDIGLHGQRNIQPTLSPKREVNREKKTIRRTAKNIYSLYIIFYIFMITYLLFTQNTPKEACDPDGFWNNM